MRHTLIFLILVLFHQEVYPQIPFDTTNYCDNYFGVEICDPYKCLEDTCSQKTKDWIKEQEITYNSYLDSLTDKDIIKQKLISYRAYYDNIEKKGDYYFKVLIQEKNKPRCLYYKKYIFDDAKLLFDPCSLNEKEDDIISIQNYVVSRDSKYIAILTNKNGSDWRDIHIVKLKNRKVLKDKVSNVIYTRVRWKETGFYYMKYPENDELNNPDQILYYHELGTNENQDSLIYKFPNIKLLTNWFNFSVTNNSLILYTGFIDKEEKVQKSIAFVDLKKNNTEKPTTFFIAPAEKEFNFNVIKDNEDHFIVYTDYVYSNSSVLSLNKDSINFISELITPRKSVLQHLYYVNEKYVCLYYLNGRYSIIIYDKNGKQSSGYAFPIGCNISELDSLNSKEAMFFIESYYFPQILYKINLETLKTEPIKSTEINFDYTKYQTDYVTYKSKDGTEIPMYLTYKKGLKRNGKNPTILYGYGGFGIGSYPTYSPQTILLIENNGIFAVPNLRGGDEKGSDWYINGKKENKINTINDFIYAAKYLVDSSYTCAEKLAINGASNGGLLVGSAMAMASELFKVVVAEVGLYDMLRYHKFKLTATASSSDEYGVSTDSLDFQNLLRYSPLHNLKDSTKYPACLIVTAENDDRCPPIHSYKFTAALNDKNNGDNPIVLKITKSAGHYGDETWERFIESRAIKYAFIFKNLGIDVYLNNNTIK